MRVFKFFMINKDYYLYDTNSNKLVEIDFDTHEFLRKNYIDLKNNRFVSKDNQFIRKLQREGLLLSNKLSRIENPLNPLIPSLLDRKLLMLSLQITQKCNLKCDYCQYAGMLYNNRTHSNLSMDKTMAIRTIDFFLKHSIDNKSIYIGYYGGEPLIEFSLVKDITHYVLTKGLSKTVNFLITTNGILLDEEKIEFLVKNRFRVSISLDGPQDVHDLHRKDYRGKGTFSKLMKWIFYIKRKYPVFFEKNIVFNSVNYGYENKKRISDFFIKNHYNVESILLSDLYSKYEQNYSNNDVYEEYEKFKIILYLKGYKRFNSIFLSDFVFAKRIMKNMLFTKQYMPKIFHPTGPCIPGVKRLFVNIDGKFFPCERSNELCESICIGDIEWGFDLNKILNIINIAKITSNECKRCWAIRFCYSCALSSIDSNRLEISKEKRLSMCQYRKQKILKAFETIVRLEKLGCDWNAI